MRRWLALMTLVGIVLAGCGSFGIQTLYAGGPIDPHWVLVLQPSAGVGKATFIDPETQKVMREFSLRQHFFMDYAVAPNGKIYIPLDHTPAHPENFVGVIDRQAGTLRKIPIPLWATTTIEILADGTAFIASGTLNEKEEIMVQVFDTNTDRVLGAIALPVGVILMTPLSPSEILIPTQDQHLDGHIFIATRQMGPLRELFPFPLEPSAPAQIQFSPDHKLAYLLMIDNPENHPKLERYRASGMDERLLTQHIAVWDMTSLQLIRRIYLPATRPAVMLLGPTGKLYVGYEHHPEPVPFFSVVDPETGAIENVPTIDNPWSLMIQGDRLYAGSYNTSWVEIFRLPNLTREGRVPLESVPMLAPKRL